MSKTHNSSLLPLAQARAQIAAQIPLLKGSEDLPVSHALGRILAEDVISQTPVPAVDNSAMDGYALNSEDLTHSNTLTLIGQSLAGHPFQGKIGSGQCVRITTGASVPQGANSVMMQENTQVNSSEVLFTQNVAPGQAIRKAGQDIQIGQVLFKAGHAVSAVDIGLLTSLGLAEVTVYRRPTVALFSTGDELKQPGQTLSHGDIYDSNRPAIHAMLSQLPVEIIDYGVIPDNEEALRNTFVRANEEADVIVTSGGVSVGDADYTGKILAELGDIAMWKLAVKPGKPFAFGHLSNSVFFGLPGNPVSALVTFHQLALPAILQMAGKPAAKQQTLRAVCVEPIRKHPGRTDFQRGCCHISDTGQLEVKNTGNQSSGILTSLSNANCFIVLEQERGNVAPGESVDILLFDHYLQA